MLPILNYTWGNLYTYPIILGFAWGLGFHFSKYLIDQNYIAFPWFNLFFVSIFCFSWIGSKLLFNFTSTETFSSFDLISMDFWFGGGFVFYGGLLSGLIFCLILLLVNKNFRLIHFSYLLPPLSLAHAVGRIGCFLSGCCYGKEYDGILSVVINGRDRHPVQLYESVSLIILTLILIRLLKKGFSPFFIFSTYFLYYAFSRFFLEFLRGDEIRGHFYIYKNLFLSSSQLISLALIIFLVAMIVFKKTAKPKSI